MAKVTFEALFGTGTSPKTGGAIVVASDISAHRSPLPENHFPTQIKFGIIATKAIIIVLKVRLFLPISAITLDCP